MREYEDWADWAGDHPQQAERESAQAKANAKLGLSPSGIDLQDPEQEVCQHTEVYETGHCADCGDEVEGFEPTDAQIFAHYGQTKETAA